LSTSRDEADLVKDSAKLDSFTPFLDDKSLRHIITAVTANKIAKEHDLFTIVTPLSRIRTKGV
jgi:hypothetical protein